MSDTKISNPAPNWCRTCGRRPNDPMAALCLDTHHLPLERLHPQPAELAKQQEVELPPLPPVDGYDKRVHGHYSAEQMRDYARNAIRSAKQEQACSGLGIDKMAKELLERHTVAVPVAVEDGRCFMVREQDALDAICAALAATGKQQVGEVQGDALAHALEVLRVVTGRAMQGSETRLAYETVSAALARQQSAGQVVGHVSRDSSKAHMCVNLPEGSPLYALAGRQPGAQEANDYVEFLDRQNDSLRRAIHAIMAKIAFLLDEDQFADVDAIALAAGVAPPAQGIDLGRVKRYALDDGFDRHRGVETDKGAHLYEHDDGDWVKWDDVEALIDQRDAAPGVGNG